MNATTLKAAGFVLSYSGLLALASLLIVALVRRYLPFSRDAMRKSTHADRSDR